MSDNLFDIPEQLSPKMRWLRKYRVATHHAPHCEVSPWSAWFPSNDHNGIPNDPDACGYGDSKEGAIVDLARRHGVPTWQDEKLKQKKP